MADWKQHEALAMFDPFERMILRVAAGDDQKINRLMHHSTHAEVALAIMSSAVTHE